MLEITDQICGSHWNPYAMDFYPYNRSIMESCGLTSLPDRRTFDRRLSTISADIKERIATMANLFVKEKLVDPYIIAIDSRLLRNQNRYTVDRNLNLKFDIKIYIVYVLVPVVDCSYGYKSVADIKSVEFIPTLHYNYTRRALASAA